MRLAQHHQIRHLVRPAVLTMDDVVNVEVGVAAASRHPAAVPVAVHDHATRRRWDVLPRTLDEHVQHLQMAPAFYERVQDANTMAVLWQLGVEFIQGYFVHAPEEVVLG